MEFDVDTIIHEMVLAVRKSLQKDYKEAETVAQLFLEANKADTKNLQNIAFKGKSMSTTSGHGCRMKNKCLKHNSIPLLFSQR